MCHCSMDGKLLDLSWTLLGGEVKMVKWLAIWFHWTPESIPLWSEFRCIQMIFLGLVQCCGEPWRNAAMPSQDNSSWKLLQKYSRQTIPFRNSEIQNRTPEIYNIQKHWQHTHRIPTVKPSQTSTAICCWKASSLLPKPVLRLSNMLKMIESFASWESCKTVGVRTSYASSYARFANLQESAASCVCDVIVAPKHRTQQGQELSHRITQVHIIIIICIVHCRVQECQMKDPEQTSWNGNFW